MKGVIDVEKPQVDSGDEGKHTGMSLLCIVKAKFHYTDTDTDFFAAKLRWIRAGPFRRKKVRVRVRVGPVSVSV